GKAAAVEAIQQYAAVNSMENHAKAAKVAEALFDQAPAGEFGTQVGQAAMYHWNTAQQWAKVLAAGTKMLARNLPADKDRLQDRPDHHQRLIQSLYQANAKPAELEAALTAYYQKYPKALEKGALRGLLALSLIANKETARGLAVLAEVLPDDARTQDYAGQY